MKHARRDYDIHHRLEARDRWPLALYEYQPLSRPEGPPILMVHGSNCCSDLYDLGVPLDGQAGGARGLAPFLSEKGRRVFCLDLRGHGQSLPLQSLSRLDARLHKSWNFEDFVDDDLPTAVQFVLHHTGEPQLDYVGFSMGSLIGFAGLRGAPYVRRMVSIGAADIACMGRRPDGSKIPGRFDLVGLMSALGHLGPYVSLEPVFRLGSLMPRSRLTRESIRIALNPDNVTDEILQGVLRRVLLGCSARKMHQLKAILGSAHADQERFPPFDLPTLYLGGADDRLVRPESVRRSVERATHPESEARILGVARGDRDDYGHIDLLTGRHAAQEVFPQVLEFFHPTQAVGPAMTGSELRS